MTGLDDLKKRIASKGKEDAKPSVEQKAEERVIDMGKVDNIVNKMKKKYKKQGVEFEAVGGELKELRGIIAEGKTKELEVRKVEGLKKVKSPIIKSVGKIYLKLRGILGPFSKLASKLPAMKSLSFFLYSANMRYSASQYLALAVTGAAIVFFAVFALTSAMMFFVEMELPFKIAIVPLISLIASIIALIVIMLIPKQKAKNRGNAISIELPFALRHMATELRAGIGLYRTIQAIATAGYGALSEEFARTITEIEEGTDTKDALNHLALRTQSKALRSALMHIMRALKTGGNLSDIMNEIAEDVSFDMRLRTRDFAAKMNFFGVIFIFTAIVMPVVIAVLGGIRNSPLQGGGVDFKSLLPLTPEIIAAIYLVVMPLMLGLFIVYIMLAQPKV